MVDARYAIPRANSSLSNGDGSPTTEWYNYLRGLNVAATGTNADLLNDITIISTKLGSPDGTPENIPPISNISGIAGNGSILVTGTSYVNVSLVGDVAFPGNTYYYGTGPTGVKGFYTVASALLGSTGDITLTTGADGVTTIDLATVTQGPSGVLTAIALDTKGRVVQSHAVTVTGTAHQVIVTGGDGSGTTIGLSLPQDIDTSSSPSFAAVNLAADPTTALEAATKQYVDTLAAGLSWKAPVQVATTANITLSGPQAIDGVSVFAGARVLVKDQTTPANNGIYVVASGAWTRATDMDSWAEVPNASVFVSQGTTNADKAWTCTADAGGTLGTTAIPFVQFTGATGGVTSWNGRTGTVVPVSGDYAFSDISGTITPATQMPASGVTAGTYGDLTHAAQITVNAQGLVVAASQNPMASGGGTVTLTTSEPIAAGAMVNVWVSGGVQVVRNATAIDGVHVAHGFVLSSYGSGVPATVYIVGSVCTGLSGLTSNDVYLATTGLGNVTPTPTITVGSGNLLQRLGTALSATSFLFDPDDGIVL